MDELDREPESGPPLKAFYGGISLLGEQGYERLMQDLKPDEHAIFIIANGQVSFKGSGFVRGGIYDRVQVRQDAGSFTFRDTDYQNLYHL